MLEIKTISKTYNNHLKRLKVIKHITVNIKDKEFVAFIGPSGCGKTTLLKCIAGLINPTSGEILLNNKKILSPGLDIGMIFQDYSLFPWLTTLENIEFGLKVRKYNKEYVKKLANKYLKVVGLDGFNDFYPKFLSGGMKQRVAIARTLVNNPKIVLMDEPFGSLDNITRGRMQEFLINLYERNKKTIIFVTHDIEEAIFLADRVIILSQQPATTIKEFNVPFQRPRKAKIKQARDFLILKDQITKLLD